MTLVFSYDFGVGPWLVADTMLSSTRLPKEVIPLPTGDVNDDSVKKLSLFGLTSKIARYDDFVIGWAGSLSKAKEAICLIEQHHNETWWTREDLHRILRDEAESGAVAFILHELSTCNSLEPVIRTVFGEHFAEGQGRNRVIAIGSGAPEISKLLFESPYASRRAEVRQSFELNQPSKCATEDFLCTVAPLITSEAGWWLRRNCGGMYQCCLPELGDPLEGKIGYQRFKFFDNCVVYLWEVTKTTQAIANNSRLIGQGTIKIDSVFFPMLPWRRIALGYIGEYFCMRSLDFDGVDASNSTVVVLHSPGIAKPELPTSETIIRWLRSQDINHGTTAEIVYGDPLESMAIVKVICNSSISPTIETHTAEPSVNYSEDDDGVSISVSLDFIREISQHLKNMLDCQIYVCKPAMLSEGLENGRTEDSTAD